VGEAIGEVLSFGVGVSLSPVPVIAVVLMLATPHGGKDGPAFLLGWVVGLGAVGTIILLISSGADASDDGAPATWASLLQLVLGLALVALAVKQWRGRPQGGAEPALPQWMSTIDRFTPARAVAMGVALSAINPKNLILVAGAAAAIAATGASAGDQAVALAVFVAVGTLGPGVPVAISFLLGDRAQEVLDGLKRWMARESTTIMAVLCLVIGAKLIGDAISGLAT
jgi:threonine/homoserine/homoserine lactone efflux protein